MYIINFNAKYRRGTPQEWLYLDEVLARDGSVVALAIFRESWNRDAAVVVRACCSDERVAYASADSLESTSSTGVDDNVRVGLVDGVESSERAYWGKKGYKQQKITVRVSTLTYPE
jgi:hypothetical protein